MFKKTSNNKYTIIIQMIVLQCVFNKCFKKMGWKTLWNILDYSIILLNQNLNKLT